MTESLGESVTKPVLQAIGKSFAAIADQLISGIGGERFAERAARVENKKAEILLRGKIERDQMQAAAEQRLNLQKLGYEKEQELVRRAIERFATDAAWNELNLEEILVTSKRIGEEPKYTDKSFSFEGKADWLFQWFKYARDISAPELQELWARIIVEQTQERGHGISLKALDALRFLEKSTAETFAAIVKRRIISECCLDYEFIGEPRRNEEASHKFIADVELLKDIGLIRSSTYQTMSIEAFSLSFSFSEIDVQKPGVLHAIDLSRLGEDLAEIAVPGFLGLQAVAREFHKTARESKRDTLPRERELAPIFERTFDAIGQIAVMCVLEFGYSFKIKELESDSVIGELRFDGNELGFEYDDSVDLCVQERWAIKAVAQSIREEAHRVLPSMGRDFRTEVDFE